MKKPKKVYVVFKVGEGQFDLGLNVYENIEDAKKMWEDRTGKLYDENKNQDRENGCYLMGTYINS